MTRHPETGREETDKERIDRNLEEFLGELRVALPGVQVLFAFLLVVPFNDRFSEVTSFQRSVYFVTLLCAAFASICLIAPTVHHRIEFRRRHKERILIVSNALAVLGLVALSAAMIGAILLITDVVYAGTTTAIAVAAVVAAFVVIWFGIPLRRLVGGGDSDGAEE